MHITVPLNFGYIKHKYQMTDHFTSFIENYVIPELIARLSRDYRVQSIEIISDLEFKPETFGSEKVTLTFYSIDKDLSANEVAGEILRVRQNQTRTIVQYNPLFPFVSVQSLWDAFSSVEEKNVLSAVGSFIQKEKLHDLPTAKEHDLGVFNVYSQESFEASSSRQALPTKVIGLTAIELIGLRSSQDHALFDLIVNSGFEV